MPKSVRSLYEARAKSGELEPDSIQRALADQLDDLATTLAARKARRPKLLTRLLDREAPRPRGIYIWGGVGRGKTLLMDLFFQAVPTRAKRRIHFHEFMEDVHVRIHAFRQKMKSGETKEGDPIPPVAAEIASGIRLLCFDEFSVRDIADAMILGRLFEQLFERLTVVATSNTAPDDLYRDGLNRALFLPFIALLKERMAIFHLDAPRDYRLDGEDLVRRYLTPLGADAEACLAAHFHHLAHGEKGKRRELVNKGRRIVVPEAADGIARFSFDDLCAQPLGAADYFKIASNFHTIILSDVPVLDASLRNEARRLIDLIDTLYDRRRRLIVSAEAEPDALWREGGGAEGADIARTISRLTEMRSDDYWEAASAEIRKQ